MDAKALVGREGESLIGKRVWTYPMGGYPGGVAVVSELHPDPAAPEIVCNVIRKGKGAEVEIGVFGYEQLILIDKEE